MDEQKTKESKILRMTPNKPNLKRETKRGKNSRRKLRNLQPQRRAQQITNHPEQPQGKENKG